MGEKLEAELNPLVMTACQLAAARIRVHNSKQTQRRQRTLIFSSNVTTPLLERRQCWGKTILPRAGYRLGTYRTVDIFNFSLIS